MQSLISVHYFHGYLSFGNICSVESSSLYLFLLHYQSEVSRYEKGLGMHEILASGIEFHRVVELFQKASNSLFSEFNKTHEQNFRR